MTHEELIRNTPKKGYLAHIEVMAEQEESGERGYWSRMIHRGTATLMKRGDRHYLPAPNDHCEEWAEITFQPTTGYDGDMHYSYDPVSKDTGLMQRSFHPGFVPLLDWILKFHALIAPIIDAEWAKEKHGDPDNKPA